MTTAMQAYPPHSVRLMTLIKNRKHPCLRHGTTTVALLTTLALANPTAHAATADDAGWRRPKKGAVELDEVKVEAHGVYPAAELSSPKFTQPILDTPQTIQVIDGALFNQQGATTLTEALRNSAGVGTFYAGENGSTSTGDAVSMRGFDTSGSLFVDGVRDLGSIARDVFNIEQIEVVKGPAGTDNGRTAPTGAINLVSKQAQLRDADTASVSMGVDGQQRASVDLNHILGAASAVRVNAMWQDSDVAGRDRVNNRRWGIAPSLAWGIGGDTEVVLNLLSVRQDNIPDGFVPTIGLPGWQPQAGQEALVGHPVDSRNFYGSRLDHDRVRADMATLKIEHVFNEALILSNVLRWGATQQDYLLTSFMTTGGNVTREPGADPEDLTAYQLARTVPTLKDQRNGIWTDQLNLRAEFATGAIQHTLSTGLELSGEKQDADNFTVSGSLPPVSLYAPDWTDLGNLSWQKNGTIRNGWTDTTSVYLFDSLEFSERWLAVAGLRVDQYRTGFQSTAICNRAGNTGTGRGVVLCGDAPLGSIVDTAKLKTEDSLFNWKLGVVYKPTANLSLYAHGALAQQPPGGANFELSTSTSSANNPNLDPQKSETIELGGKWTLLDEHLLLAAALYRTDVTNEINTQVLDDAGNPTQTGAKQVQGFELSAQGSLSENWNVSAGYNHQHATVTEGAPVANDGTLNLTYTPGDSFTAWTSYHWSSGVTLGVGARYMDGLHRGRDGAVGTPEKTEAYTVFDAVLNYELNERLSVRLNAYNLADKHYVAAINKSGYRYLPGVARTLQLSADIHF